MWSCILAKKLIKKEILYLMKKTPQNKRSYILLSLMIIWTGILLITYDIPNLLSAIQFSNSVKYEVFSGYASEYFIQRDIISRLSYFIFDVASLIITIAFLVMSIFKPKMIKAVGITIIAQNIIVLLLRLWYGFFTNGIDSVKVDIKWYLCFAFVATIVLSCLSYKRKFFYLMLVVITILQGINSVYFMAVYIKNILDIGILNMIIGYCGLTIILVLYWLLLLFEMNIVKNEL